ncbi:MAG: hypothetical protein IJE23_03640 [Tyzzerella sp.]|nr:hypothetical protein [Tyzzerella sp.]
MKMSGFWNKSKMLNSSEAEMGAEKLMRKIQQGNLCMEILPNKYKKFNGELEEKDYVSYCDFLKCIIGRKVLAMLEEEDGRCNKL